MLALCLVVAALWLGLLAARLSTRRRHFLRSFPSPPGVPLLGHALLLRGDPSTIFRTSRRLSAKYGPRYFMHVLNFFAINICDADSVEAVLSSSKHITKGKLYDFLMPWLGRGLLTNNGASWHQRRKLLTSAFHFRILDEFGPRIQKHADQLVRDLGELARSGPVDVVTPVSRNTLRTICETAMGTDLQASTEAEDEYFEAVRIVGDSIAYRFTRPWLWNEFIFSLTPLGRKTQRALRVLHGLTRQVLNERKIARGQEAVQQQQQPAGPGRVKRRLAFLDLLLAAQEEKAGLTDQDIIDEVDTFMFEGHETTAMAICWTLFLLGNHPDIQERAREEVLGVGADHQEIVSLQYLEMVIKESLRMYPPVFFISRFTGGELEMSSTQKVPEGTLMDMHIFDVHRDPAHFPDPERFDPDRFLPENEQGRHPFAFIPFSGGLRNCIGKRFAMLELKVMLACVLKTFTLRSELAAHQLRLRPDLLLGPDPEQGIVLRLTPLHSKK